MSKVPPKTAQTGEGPFRCSTIIFCLVAALGLVLVQLRWACRARGGAYFSWSRSWGWSVVNSEVRTNQPEAEPLPSCGKRRERARLPKLHSWTRRSPRASKCIPARPSSCRDGGLEIAERTLRHMEQTEMSGKTRGSDAGSMCSVRSSMPADDIYSLVISWNSARMPNRRPQLQSESGAHLRLNGSTQSMSLPPRFLGPGFGGGFTACLWRSAGASLSSRALVFVSPQRVGIDELLRERWLDAVGERRSLRPPGLAGANCIVFQIVEDAL